MSKYCFKLTNLFFAERQVPDRKHSGSLNIITYKGVNIREFSLTLNNNGINDSFSNFWHDGTCFE